MEICLINEATVVKTIDRRAQTEPKAEKIDKICLNGQIEGCHPASWGRRHTESAANDRSTYDSDSPEGAIDGDKIDALFGHRKRRNYVKAAEIVVGATSAGSKR